MQSVLLRSIQKCGFACLMQPCSRDVCWVNTPPDLTKSSRAHTQYSDGVAVLSRPLVLTAIAIQIMLGPYAGFEAPPTIREHLYPTNVGFSCT